MNARDPGQKFGLSGFQVSGDVTAQWFHPRLKQKPVRRTFCCWIATIPILHLFPWHPVGHGGAGFMAPLWYLLEKVQKYVSVPGQSYKSCPMSRACPSTATCLISIEGAFQPCTLPCPNPTG